MIRVLGIGLLCQVLLIFGGWGLLQLACPRTRIAWPRVVPFAWGGGVLVTYLLAHLLVRTEWMLGGWHVAVAAGLSRLALPA